jgi:hypothetical protein
MRKAASVVHDTADELICKDMENFQKQKAEV